MKCPKCGYNSFEYLNSCKKCNSSLVAFKGTIGLHPDIIPAGAVAATAAYTGMQQTEAGSSETDVFHWDVPPSEPSPSIETGETDELASMLQGESPPEASGILESFSFDELPVTEASGHEPVEESGIEEFSFNLKGNTPEVLLQEDAGIFKEASKQPMEYAASGSSPFGELPHLETEDIFPQHVPPPSENTDQQLPQFEDANVFGEFSFDDLPVAAEETPLNEALPDIVDLPSTSGFDFDAFGDVEASDLQEVPAEKTVGATAEFDLSSFLATDETFTVEETGKKQNAEVAELEGGELDSLLGELTEPDKVN